MQKKITVYSTSWCGFCHQLKSWLKSKNLDFTEVDLEIDENAQKEVELATGGMSVPVTKIDQDWVVGFDRKKIEELLSKQ